MTLVRVVHEDDQLNLNEIQAELIASRQALGLSQRDVSRFLGYKSKTAVYMMEADDTRWRLSTLQHWASTYGLCVAWDLSHGGEPFDVGHDAELEMLYELSRTHTAYPAQRAYLVAVLVAARQQLGLTQLDVDNALGLAEGGCSYFERYPDTVSVVTAMSQARGIGLVLRWRLVHLSRW